MSLPKAAASAARTVPVPLGGDRSYNIYIGEGLISAIGDLVAQIARGGRIVIISQPVIARSWSAPLIDSLNAAGFADVAVLTFPAGERYKTLNTVSLLYKKLYSLVPAIDRSTLVVALGGGVVGDVAGYVAATYLRGLRYVQVPTTLLAMVDSSVGGKTGVDFEQGKNLIGAFHQPRAVYIDTRVLTTLPEREYRSGLGEVVKYGVIAEPGLLDTLKMMSSTRDGQRTDFLREIIGRCCEIKADIVSRDEFEETGLRATLNFGHTIGHALESATQYRRFKHGEAVAIGMIAATHIGELNGQTPASVRPALRDALTSQGLPVCIPADIAPESLIDLLGHDKKALAGKARFVFARALGEVNLVDTADDRSVLEGLRRSYGTQ